MRLLDNLETRVRRVASAALSSLFGGLLVLCALGFLSAAFWIFLSGLWGAMVAALVVGGLFLILAAVVFASGAAARRAAPAPQTRAEEVTVAELVEAFMIGLNAGKASRGPRAPE